MHDLQWQDLTWEPSPDGSYTRTRVPRAGPGFTATFYAMAKGARVSRESHLGYDDIHVVNGTVDVKASILATNDSILFLEEEAYVVVAVEPATVLVITERRGHGPH